jgi:flagellar motor switch protein FliM
VSAAAPGTNVGAQGGAQTSKPQTIHPCNFRYAGRLSNENARALTVLHEKLALNVASSLEVYLGASLRMKLLTLEQLAIQDYIGSLVPNSYLLPCALNVMDSNFLMEMDIPLIFPIIDLLLGGAGTTSDEVRELTEIDEEIMQSVSIIIVQQIERSWRALNVVLTPGRCIKPTIVPQIFPINEKLVVLTFEMEIAEMTGHFKIVLPTSFVGFLLRHMKAIQSKKRLNLRQLPNPSLRERILECNFLTSVDITNMRVMVKDLVDLRPGTILKMKAPVKNPGRLTVEDVDIFEAVPVRSGPLKAAQLVSRPSETAATKD